MTWSILAYDTTANVLGAAIASKFLAVGALCISGHGQHGVLATQGLLNPMHLGRGQRLLSDGYRAKEALCALLAGDEGSHERQVHLIDRTGNISQHTGSGCASWRGGVSGDNVSVMGNRLAGPLVVENTRDTYLRNVDRQMAERLILAMASGDAAGGDLLGKQSVALRIWRGEEYPLVDLRVDDHSEPFEELSRLYKLAQKHYLPYSSFFGTRLNPAGIFVGEELDSLYRKRKSDDTSN